MTPIYYLCDRELDQNPGKCSTVPLFAYYPVTKAYLRRGLRISLAPCYAAAQRRLQMARQTVTRQDIERVMTAARLGGVMVAPEIEHVYGSDAIGALTEVLRGNEPGFPARMFTDADASGAAGSLSLIATDADGHPWSERLDAATLVRNCYSVLNGLEGTLRRGLAEETSSEEDTP